MCRSVSRLYRVLMDVSNGQMVKVDCKCKRTKQSIFVYKTLKQSCSVSKVQNVVENQTGMQKGTLLVPDLTSLLVEKGHKGPAETKGFYQLNWSVCHMLLLTGI